MSKKWKIAVGVIVAVVAFTGLGLLRWGEAIYWISGGERGWSLGVSAYQVLGWGSEAYRSDFGWDDALEGEEARWTDEFDARLVDDDGDGVPDRAVVEVPSEHRGRFGHGFDHDIDHGISRHHDRGGHAFF